MVRINIMILLPQLRVLFTHKSSKWHITMYNYFSYSNKATIVALPGYLDSATIGDQFLFTFKGGYLTYLASLSGATNLTLSTTHEGCMCYNTNRNIYVALFRYSEFVEVQLKALTKESNFRPRCAHLTQISVQRWPPLPPLVSTTQPSVSTTQSRPPRSPLVSTTQSRPQRPPLNGFVHHDPLTKLP